MTEHDLQDQETQPPMIEPMYIFDDADSRDQWFAANKRMLIGAAIGGAVTGFVIGHSLASTNEQNSNAENLNQAQRYERCVDFIKDTVKPGQTSITISRNSLTAKQQQDCGIDGIASSAKSLAEALNNTDSVYGVGGNIKATINTVVTTPTIKEYSNEIADLKHSAGYNHIEVGLMAGMGGLLGFMSGASLMMRTMSRRMHNKSNPNYKRPVYTQKTL